MKRVGKANYKQRVLDVMTEDERLCDWQASFLIEVLSQYRARRAAKTLSSRFENMYHKVTTNRPPRLTTPANHD